MLPNYGWQVAVAAQIKEPPQKESWFPYIPALAAMPWEKKGAENLRASLVNTFERMEIVQLVVCLESRGFKVNG